MTPGILNGDARPNIVTGSEAGSEVRVYLNQCPARALEASPRATVGSAKIGEEPFPRTSMATGGSMSSAPRWQDTNHVVEPLHRIARQTPGRARSTRAFPETANLQLWMQAALHLDNTDWSHGAHQLPKRARHRQTQRQRSVGTVSHLTETESAAIGCANEVSRGPRSEPALSNMGARISTPPRHKPRSPTPGSRSPPHISR